MSTPPVRRDPEPDAVPGQEAVYAAIQSLWSARARRRFRTDFDDVTAFCLFIGYPRSGHSVVGAMLNAHRHAVIAHELDAPELLLGGCNREELYARILARAAWFNLRGNTSNYRYQIPNRWQGRFESLRVIGDKGGGWTAQWLEKHPDLLQRFRDTVRVPLRLIHVVRNPFDNIAAISLWHRMSLDESIDFYFAHCDTTVDLPTVATDDEVTTVRHEEFIRSPASTLSTLAAFLGLECDADYLAACSSIMFDRPTASRQRVTWSAAQRIDVERRAQHYPFLQGYQFEIADEQPPPAGSASRPSGLTGRRSNEPEAHSVMDRIAAFINPRVGSSSNT